jgi:acid stress-induced BolA-like protein IbaG/YrbA
METNEVKQIIEAGINDCEAIVTADAIHALTIKAYTKSEWAEQNS